MNCDFDPKILTSALLSAGSIVILCRNPTLNPADFFDRTFEEYKNGFAANGICRKRTRQAFSNDDSITGEGWLGLEKMHQITSKKMYRLKITLTARNWTEYVGYYDWMKVGWGFRNCFWLFTERQQLLPHHSDQVTEGKAYRLRIGQFLARYSTLGDALSPDPCPRWQTGHTRAANMSFSAKWDQRPENMMKLYILPRDLDQDENNTTHCANATFINPGANRWG